MQHEQGTDEREGRDWQGSLSNTDRGVSTGSFGAGGSGGGTAEDLYGGTPDIRRDYPTYRGRSGTDWSSTIAWPLIIGGGAALLAAWLFRRPGHDQGYWQDRAARFRPTRDRSTSTHVSPSRTVEVDETGDLIASDKVEGTAVYNRNGEKLGSVHNFMVGKRSGRVAYAVLSFGGLLGMGESYFPLPWSVLTYNTDLSGYVVDLSKERLNRAPRYSAGEDPFSDPTFGSRVRNYWSRSLM